MGVPLLLVAAVVLFLITRPWFFYCLLILFVLGCIFGGR